VWLHVLLFALTLASTTFVGADFYASFVTELRARPLVGEGWRLFVSGLRFSVPALLILGCHEAGHYFACRYYRVRASLPYFLPAVVWIPVIGFAAIFPFGTFGAVIRIREPLRYKRVLFHMGIAGPLAGMAVALPTLILGLLWSTVTREPVTSTPPIYFGEPLAFQLLSRVLVGPIADGSTLNLHPAGWAAWFGLFVTGLNLLPVGQLDGGHIAYACLGRHAQWLTYAALLAAIILGVTLTPMWLTWLVLMGALLSLFGWRHPPVIDESAPLGATRWVLALLALVILVLCFIPVPIS
jgi:membrane-associated protease RseP (regulator of RpoE activity)